MNKIEKAIKWFDRFVVDAQLIGCKEAVDVSKTAIDALRKELESQCNDPLSTEELMEKDGKPIWVVPMEKNPDWLPQWRIFEYGDEPNYILVQSVSHEPRMYLLYLRDYGKTWLAYRRNPGVNNAGVVAKSRNRRAAEDERI